MQAIPALILLLLAGTATAQTGTLREMKPSSAPVPDALESGVVQPLVRCAERRLKHAPAEVEASCRSALGAAALRQQGDLRSALVELRTAKERHPDNASYYAQIETAVSSGTTAVAQTAQQQPQNMPAQQQGRSSRLSEPDRGSVSGQSYRNEFFGLTYGLPQGWVSRSQEELKKLDEAVTRETMKRYPPNAQHLIETGVLVILNHWTLLHANPPTPESAPRRFTPVILLIAEEGNPLQRDLDSYFPFADFLQDRAHRLEGKPTAQTYGGRKFVRADFRVKASSGKVWETRLVTLAKGYFLVLEIATEDRQELDRLAETANSISFSTAQE